MRMRRRDALLGAAAMLAVRPVLADGSAYPQRPVRLIIPFAPGGGTDNLARVMEPHVNRHLGQTQVIETRPGAGGVIGSEAVARAEPDGYTLMMTDASFGIIPGLYPRLPFDVLRDFAPISLLATGSSVLLVNPSLPIRSVQELLAYARLHPGELSYASGGNGTGPHLAAELVKQMAHIDMVHVPYRGTGPATTDVVAGHVMMMFNGISAAKPHIDAGRLIPLAVTGDVRNRALPDVPTFTEQGLPGIEAASNWGVFAPAHTPEPILQSPHRSLFRRSEGTLDRGAAGISRLHAGRQRCGDACGAAGGRCRTLDARDPRGRDPHGLMRRKRQ